MLDESDPEPVEPGAGCTGAGHQTTRGSAKNKVEMVMERTGCFCAIAERALLSFDDEVERAVAYIQRPFQDKTVVSCLTEYPRLREWTGHVESATVRKNGDVEYLILRRDTNTKYSGTAEELWMIDQETRDRYERLFPPEYRVVRSLMAESDLMTQDARRCWQSLMAGAYSELMARRICKNHSRFL